MAKHKNKKHHKKPAMKTKMAIAESMHTDPNGSYTGRPVNKDEVPVQDADDL